MRQPQHRRPAGWRPGVISLIYVSRALLPADGRDLALAQLVRSARAANARTQVSGALIFTGTRFAQLLEGEADPVHQLFELLQDDPRHTDIVKLAEWPIAVREFAGWSLAYEGPSAYVDGTISKTLALASRGSTPEVHHLVRMMVEFTRARDPD